MQEVDFMLLEQAFSRQGKEPNPGRTRGEGTVWHRLPSVLGT